jgi:dipeptidyl aminopeptidase/acylaminoacyl peptidase
MKRVVFWTFVLTSAAVVASDDVKPPVLNIEGYVRPSKEIEDVVTAPWYRNFSVSNVSPDGKFFVQTESAGLPKLADLARPYHNLGGLQVDWRANRQRSTVFRRVNAFNVRPISGSGGVKVSAPKGASLGNPTWSPDGKRLAYLAHFDRGSFLYVADAATGRSKQVTSPAVLAVLETGVTWLSDSKRLVAVFVPSKRAPMPEAPAVASTPRVKVSDDKATSLRTYAGLMDAPHEFDLLEWHVTGQLGIASIDTGKVQPVGKPAMIENVSPQADGSHFRITLMERPFSYMVPASSFPEREVVWDVKGAQVVEIAKRPLRFGTPPPGQPNDQEKRSLTWRPDGQGFSFLQVAAVPKPEEKKDPPEDEQGRGGGRFGGGAPQAGPGLRPGQKDRVMQWLPPYGEKDVKVVFESSQRINGVQYADDGKTIFITQTIDGKSRTSAVHLGDPSKLYPIVESATGDSAFFEDPGSLVTRSGAVAGSVVRMSADGKYVYLSGTKYSKTPEIDAPKPFIDRVEIETGKKERIFESDPGRYETTSLLNDEAGVLLVNRQSRTSISQSHWVETSSKKEGQITDNRDYAPDISQATKKKFTVTRNDGVKFEVEVAYPEGAKSGDKLPAFFWFYPSEFTDQAAYDRSKRTYNKNMFPSTSVSNKALLLRAGYALVTPDCPIIGADTRKNDGYVPQLRNNLAATIDAICEDGTIDRKRLGIGGHSYGAFSTLNAMVHTPYFKAGIAGDGNYNRLLTPFGFQSEQRQLWESREVYLSMSPMLYLEQITGAVLLYHGLDDQNMGTDPINSPKMFAALEALGKPAALYMYPYEDHGQIAEETVLDQWARFTAWLDKWLKNGGK